MADIAVGPCFIKVTVLKGLTRWSVVFAGGRTSGWRGIAYKTSSSESPPVSLGLRRPISMGGILRNLERTTLEKMGGGVGVSI